MRVLLFILCIGVALLAVDVGILLTSQAGASSRPETYEQAVFLVLQERGFAVTSVTIENDCAPCVERCQTYAGTVLIDIGRPVTGSIACCERWTSCSLSVPELAISNQRLPDIVDPIPLRWRLLEDELKRRLHNLW